jgi:SPP1 family predicted phage head-tail adaptor
MRPGKLRHLLSILTYTPTTNAAGETIAAYTLSAQTVYGSIEPLAGRELLNAQQIVGDSTHRITTRFTEYVGRKDRLQYEGAYPSGNQFTRIFEVESINNTDERNIELVILAHEIT